MTSQGGLATNLDFHALAEVLERSTSPEIRERLLSNPGILTSLTHSAQQLDSPTTIGDNDDPSNIRRARKRADVKNLNRLLEEEERQARQLRAALKTAAERLTTESERANEMERRVANHQKRERGLSSARRRAESEAARADTEAKAYRLRLELSNRENARAQQAVNALAADRNEAEESAARARSTARRLQEKLIFERARQLGRREGLQDGLQRGFDEGLDVGWEDGHDRGYDEMRAKALFAFEEALKNGAIQPAADFDLNAAIKSERAKMRAIAAARPNRRSALHPLSSHASTHRSSLRIKSPESSYVRGALDLEPVPFPTPRSKNENPLAPPPDIQVIATTPTDTVRARSERTVTPQPFLQVIPTFNHAPVDPLPDGFIPTVGTDGKIALPPPHEISPSPAASPTPSPNAANIPLPNTNYSPSMASYDPLNAKSPPVRRKSITTDNRAFEEAARFRREKEIAEQERAELLEMLQRERAQREADRLRQEEDEREREAERRREKELERERSIQREREREAERHRERELEIERDIQREREREAERERVRMLEKERALAREQELERERQERQRAEEGLRRKEEEAQRLLAEKEHELEHVRAAQAAQAEALAQAAIAERSAVIPQKPPTVDSNQQENNVTSPDDEGRGSSEDEESLTTDDQVKVPYPAGQPRQKNLNRMRKRKGRGSVRSATTYKTAGAMSTPLSSFSVLAPAEEAQRRKEDAIRDRQQTLAKLRRREMDEREEQERKAAAMDSRAPFKRNLSIIREQPSASDITSPARNSEEQSPVVPRTPHASLPILPIRLDRGPPENASPAIRPQANLPNDSPEQNTRERFRRADQPPGQSQDWNRSPKNPPQTIVPAPLAQQQSTTPRNSNPSRALGSSPILPPLPMDAQAPLTYGGMSPRQSPHDRIASLTKGGNADSGSIIIPGSPTTSIRDGNPPMIPTIHVEKPSRESSETSEVKTERHLLTPDSAKRLAELPTVQAQVSHPPPPTRGILKNTTGFGPSQPIIPVIHPEISDPTITPTAPVSPFAKTAEISQVPTSQTPVVDRAVTASPLRRVADKSSHYPSVNATQSSKPIIPIITTNLANGTASPVSSVAEPVMPEMFPKGEVKRKMTRPIGYKPPEVDHGSPLRNLSRAADWTKPGPMIEPDVPSGPITGVPDVQPITANAGSTPFISTANVGQPTPILPTQSPWAHGQNLDEERGISYGQTFTAPTPGLPMKSPWGPTMDIGKPNIGITPNRVEAAAGPLDAQTPGRMLRPLHSRVDDAASAPAPIIPVTDPLTRMQRPLAAQIAPPASDPLVPIIPDNGGVQMVPKTPKMQRPAASQVKPDFSDLPKTDPVLPQTPGKMLRPGMRPPSPPLATVGGPPPIVDLMSSFPPNITATGTSFRFHNLPPANAAPVGGIGSVPMARPVNGTNHAFDPFAKPAPGAPLPDASRTGPAFRRTTLPTFTPAPTTRDLPSNNQPNSSFPPWKPTKGGSSSIVPVIPEIPSFAITAPSPSPSMKNSSAKEKKKAPSNIIVPNGPQPWPAPPSIRSPFLKSTSTAPPKSPKPESSAIVPIVPHTASTETEEPGMANVFPAWEETSAWGPGVLAAPKSPAKIPPVVKPIIPSSAWDTGDSWGTTTRDVKESPTSSKTTRTRSIKAGPRKPSISTVSDEGSPNEFGAASPPVAGWGW